MDLNKVKHYLDKFGEVDTSNETIEKIRYFDEELANQIYFLRQLSHYHYTNPLVRIVKTGNGKYLTYTNMASMTLEDSLESYVDKCQNHQELTKTHITIGW